MKIYRESGVADVGRATQRQDTTGGEPPEVVL